MTENASTVPAIWVLLDDKAGHRSQALGVAQALGMPFDTRELSYGILARLPNLLLGATLASLGRESRSRLAPPWPHLVIAAGRRTAPAARAIRAASGRRTSLVQIMHPGAGVRDFALIAVPRHDAGDLPANAIAITGAPHRIDAAALDEAKARWRAALEPLARPRTAVIVGGATRRRAFDADMGRSMAAQVLAFAERTRGALMVTTSRRSGDGGAALIDRLGDRVGHLHRWGEAGENPYLGYLAWADEIVVTGESVSMCSEACGAGVPVHVFAPDELLTAKHVRMLSSLYEGGYAAPLGGPTVPAGHPPLNAAADIAEAICARVPGLS